MDDTDTITPQTQAAVDAAVVRVDALLADDPDLVHGDVVETVAAEAALYDLLTDDTRRAAYSVAGWRLATQQTWPTVAACFVTVYREAIAHRESRAGRA